MSHLPIKPKYKYSHKNFSLIKKSKKGYKQQGVYLLKAKKTHIFKPNLIELIRRLLNKKVKDGGGSLDIRIFPHYACSSKPLQSRMGKGKGKPSGFITPIYKGTPILFIHKHIEFHKIRKNLKRLRKRLPIHVKQKFLEEVTDVPTTKIYIFNK